MNNRLLLEKLNFNEPTPIQETGFKAIDNYESKESVLVFISKTGTGKTHAYLVPLINRILNNSKPFLVLVPTNELVIQVSRMIDEILDVLSKETETRQIKILSVISGLDYNELLRKTKRTKYDILVSTPAKIKYLIDNQINIKHYESVVLDEADMMFDLDFLSLIDSLLYYLKPKKTILVGATITKNMNTFINSFFGNFKMFDMTKETKLDIDYRLYLVPKEKKEERLLSLIRQINPLLSMIFVSNTAKAEWLYSYLKDNKINVCLYSAKLSINGRKKLFLEISRGKYQYVITTDVMSRGIDLIVSDVINYDFPKNFEYIWHRFGRTGRMNKKGCVHILAFSDSSEQVSINKLRSSNIELSEYKLDDDVLSKVIKKKRNDEELSLRIKAIPRPRKVTPNYKKKNQEKIKKVKQGLVKERAKEAARRKPNL